MAGVGRGPVSWGLRKSSPERRAMPNRLIGETSPYLLQHANNPVDWFPWGEEALSVAQAEDRPIFLSIGYSACHWCHVMERESFEDPDIASQMNSSFVCIKVDREERPDLDSIYMGAVQAMTGQGGWPLSVFLTPAGEPFYGGTYFPPEDRHGMPGFPRVLAAIADAYASRRGDVAMSAEQVLASIHSMTQPRTPSGSPQEEVLSRGYAALRRGFDGQHGGFGAAPKFPQPMALEFLLRHHHRTGDRQAREMVETTLRSMARGGLYDQLGGGFHRYSTDARWVVPHFEKMLYDNALLGRLYLHAYQATGDAFYSNVVQCLLDYILREMTAPEGGFYSTQDADSEGEEGKYFVWTPGEVEKAVGNQDAALIRNYFGVTDAGNFEGRNILVTPHSVEDFAQTRGIDPGELAALLDRGRRTLLEVRGQRVAPQTDTKVLTSWNGLALATLADAAAVLHRGDYLQAAVSNATFVLARLRQDGRLLRTYKDGSARLKAYLEDYACFADGLIALYEATFDHAWLREAESLAQGMLDLFWDEADGVFYDTGNDHETLVARPRDVNDGAMPCGGSMAAHVLLKLAFLTGESAYESAAATALETSRWVMERAPLGAGHWLGALDLYLSPRQEIAVVGPARSDATQALLDVVHQRYLPNRVLAGFDPEDPAAHDDIPVLQGKVMLGGLPTAYLCQHYACQQPVTEPEALLRQLQEQTSSG